MSAEIILIITLSIIILISPFISSLLKLPISVVEIAMGSIAATVGLIHKNELFSLLGEVGFLYLMLLAGMEVNLKELLKLPKSFINKSLIYIILLYLIATIFVVVFKFSIIFVILFSLISVGLMLSISQEVGKTDWLEDALKVGVLGELISIIALTVVSVYFEYGASKEFIINIGILVAVLIFFGFLFMMSRTIFWWFPKLKHNLMPKDDKYYQDVRIAMSLFFIMIALMLVLHLDVVLGAFVVGVFLSTFFEHNKDLEHKLSPFGFGFLITIFFVFVGSSLDLKNISIDMLKDAFFITFIMVFIRVISSLIVFRNGMNSILLALSLSMPLTLLIATATVAHNSKMIDDYWYMVLILTSIVEVLIIMLSIKFLHKIAIISKKG